MALILPLLFAALIYFLFIRPQQRQMRQHQELVASLEVGDEIITSAGIFGTIIELDEDSMQVEVAEGIELTMKRQAVAEVAVDEADDVEVELDADEADRRADS